MNRRHSVAIVTGAGTGIGAASARVLAARGYAVVANGRRRERVQAVAAEVGGHAVVGDTGEEADVARLVAETVDRFGRIDALVLNAGIVVEGSAGDLPREGWDATLRTNLTGAFLVIREAVDHLLEQQGSIVAVASVGALRSAPREVAYATSKAALVGLVEGVAAQHGGAGLRANAVCPGWTRTEMADEEMDLIGQRLGMTREDAYTRATAAVPQRRPAGPEEVASVIGWLLSDAAAGLNGAAITVDGGINAIDAGTVPWVIL